MNLKQSATMAILLALIGLISWELYWRSNGYYPTIEDNDALWAAQRKRVDTPNPNDVIFIGSSRIHFDIQLDKWNLYTGLSSIMLAQPGSSPLPIFQDLVENTEFNGTIIVGVTPGLFFSTTYPEARPWKWAQSKVDYFYKQTYAQKFNHLLSIPLQEQFVFINESEMDDAINLKSLVNKFKIGNRNDSKDPPFFEFSDYTIERNSRMTIKCATDTAFANTIKKVWSVFMLDTTLPPPDKNSTTKFFLEQAKKFEARGGNLILVRCPSSGILRDGEQMGLPRERFWDSLISVGNFKSYHFEDIYETKNLDCPEWSHLSGPDADLFTEVLANLLIEDKALPNLNTN
ncbi:MAG: hypothetical protein BM564_05240 [Bacteroidetes bacterium MedPE-SWsnd-G2]|nr:MAG: hypothetical protein BM564_05240 [Bacteroidetes bacterium MedPE-SWsnd-G2]